MTDRRTRKRRRSQAFPDADDIADEPPASDANAQDPDAPREHVDGDANARERTDQEQEIWAAFREEHFEVLEQLPLSLHRSFSLMLELDQQVHGHEAQILPTLQHYIRLRYALAANPEGSANVDDLQAIPQSDAISVSDVLETQMTRSRSSHSDETRSLRSASGSSPSKKKGTTALSPTKSNPRPVPTFVPQPPSTRALLIQVAQLSEEVVRASNEKVNVARFAYDLVDRYIRDLERAIKEQETSISLGLRPGTHPASIILPEVIVPKPVRAARTAQSPEPDIDDPDGLNAARAEPDGPTLGVVSSEAPREEGVRRVAPRRRRVAKWSKKKVQKPAGGTVNMPGNAKPEAAVSPPKVRSVRLTLAPVAPNVPDASEIPLDPNEPRYCYCNQVSFGSMIACDNEGCDLEWFHWGCAGLTVAPAENAKWYCRNCEPKVNRFPRRKARS